MHIFILYFQRDLHNDNSQDMDFLVGKTPPLTVFSVYFRRKHLEYGSDTKIATDMFYWYIIG